MFGVAMLEKIAAEVQSEEQETKKLSYREVSISLFHKIAVWLHVSCFT